MAGVSDDRARWLAIEVMPYEPAVRRWLNRTRAWESEVDDIIQDAYARLVGVADVSAIQNVRAYFFRTAHSAAIDRLRRRNVIAIDAMADVERLKIAADVADPEEQAADRNELRILARMIASLPDKTRRIFMLSRVSGLPQKEIARRTGVPESTVEKHIAKAFLLLMRAYADGGFGDQYASRLQNGRRGRKVNDQRGNG